MRKFLAVALFVLFPFVAQAQQAPQAPQVPPLQAPTMEEVSENSAVIAAVVIGAAVGAVVLPLAVGGVAAAGTSAAAYATATWDAGVVAVHSYPFLSGLGAALGAWIGYSM